jgi:hypothetical protein
MILNLFRKEKHSVILVLKSIGIIFGLSLFWFFILPLDYMYAKFSFGIVQYLPIVSIGLFLIWAIREASKHPKPNDKNVEASR